MFFETSTPVSVMALRLGLAAALSTALGWERERKEKPAGLRTHMLVALGAAGFVLATLEMAHLGVGAGDHLRIDPVRIFEGVIGGIGFLGAGTIIQSRGSVQGLTTGASVWLAGCVGATSGAGYYALSVMISLLGFLVLTGVHFVEKSVLHTKRHPGKPDDDD